MDVVVSGASGLIGSALVPALREDGHTVRRLVRRKPAAADEVQWDPASHELDDAVMASADAVVNLNGVGIGDKRWTEDYKKLALTSRLDSTSTIVDAITRESSKVRVLVNGSAVGWYGNRGDDILTEADGHGDGFLADLARQWEAAATPAEAAGIRVVRVRTGIVLTPDGGALARMLPIFKLGAGGRLGSGKQWFPWISLTDEVAAIKFALTHDNVSGALNLTSPNPVTNAEFTKALGRAVKRPALAAVPPFALKLGLGGFAEEGLLFSQRAVPQALIGAGFAFTDSDLHMALSQML
ncbi:MAG TPA: TIGR01777 family oxidoreductase [Mycobacteriales bacterium]|nr:TIGR01777 family oxidoreductase [Mycobacteriales bacterium]HVX69385.1 TIGR01777 family oxidoreductase [Mycobacteriales bacterium]